MSAIFKILRFTKQFRWWYVVAALFVIITSALNLATPVISGRIVDLIIKHTSESANLLITLLAIMLATQIIQIILQSLGQWLGDILEVKLQTFLSTTFYHHLLQLHIGFYDAEVTGKVMNKMYRGIEQITGFVQNMVNNFLPFLFTAVLTILLLARYSPVIAILLTVLFPVYILISHGSTVAWKKYQDEQNALSDVSLSRAYESVAGIRVVKAFAQEITELIAFKNFRKSIEKLAIRQTRGWHAYDFARQFTLNAIIFAIYAYIVYYTFQGHYTIGEMTMMVQLVQQARFPLFAMSWILGQIQRAEAGSKDFFAVLETASQIQDRPDASILTVNVQKNKPLIEFNDVAFQYESSKSVLNRINFKVMPGQHVALVGESGQGKSTIVNLLLRFYEPQHGTIVVSDQDISQVAQASLRDQIAVVFQESLLFSGNILDNIRYARPDATMEQVIEAAKAANAHSFIEQLPDKYESVIGERGVKLSGGQKQRIAIARAILKDAPIIILDEATSALDSRSEVLVQEGLERLMHGRTAIIIAHRLSTIAHADQIVVLEGGTVAESGPPQQLLDKPHGIYTGLVQLQQSLLTAPPAVKKKKLQQFDLVG